MWNRKHISANYGKPNRYETSLAQHITIVKYAYNSTTQADGVVQIQISNYPINLQIMNMNTTFSRMLHKSPIHQNHMSMSNFLVCNYETIYHATIS